jgi:hypothetical protein
MAVNPKRKASGSQVLSTTADPGRWEDQLAMKPSECSPIAALISGVQSAHIHGGSFTVVGSNTAIQNNYYSYGTQTPTTNILEILKALSLPNFRDIQLDTLSKATDGTCIWLTTGEMFVFWVANGRILWGIGIRMSSCSLDLVWVLTERTSGSREDGPVVSGFETAAISKLTSIIQSYCHPVSLRA